MKLLQFSILCIGYLLTNHCLAADSATAPQTIFCKANQYCTYNDRSLYLAQSIFVKNDTTVNFIASDYAQGHLTITYFAKTATGYAWFELGTFPGISPDLKAVGNKWQKTYSGYACGDSQSVLTPTVTANQCPFTNLI